MKNHSQKNVLPAAEMPCPPSSEMQLLSLITGAWASQTIYATAQSGLIDKIQEGTHSTEGLAYELGVREENLHRFLNAIEAFGLISGCAKNHIELTEMGSLLCSSRSNSLRPLALFCAQGWHVETWEHLLERLNLEKPAFDHIMGMPLFDYLQGTPDDRVLFDSAMDSLSLLWGPKIVQRMNLSDARSVIDIGGGRGIFLAEILSQNHHLEGRLLDLPEALEQARHTPYLQDFISQDRCKLIEGSFFDRFSTSADTHVMKFIMHDWGDRDALTILENSRSALSVDGQLFIVEQIIDPAKKSPFTQLCDIEMLLFGNGKERTADEFCRLIEHAGFTIEDISETATPFSIIQAKPH
ncbi:methyltransferase [Pseudomonas cichorii]|nr:hypothetical protein [Pseudomonas cichorii]GFM73346.1 methyltransferase [Pseudomonas cichorii]